MANKIASTLKRTFSSKAKKAKVPSRVAAVDPDPIVKPEPTAAPELAKPSDPVEALSEAVASSVINGAMAQVAEDAKTVVAPANTSADAVAETPVSEPAEVPVATAAAEVPAAKPQVAVTIVQPVAKSGSVSVWRMALIVLFPLLLMAACSGLAKDFDFMALLSPQPTAESLAPLPMPKPRRKLLGLF
jgi:hypothetical protein